MIKTNYLSVVGLKSIDNLLFRNSRKLFFSQSTNAQDTFDKFTYKNLDGEDVSFSKYNKKCVLVINTASNCGFTGSNMKYLNSLKENPKYNQLEIIAFPSNSFNQEPLSNAELKDWFFKKWNAKYDVYAPIDVKNSDIYKFLIKNSGGYSVIWNYGKYLIEKNGKTATRYGPQAGAIISSGLDSHIEKCISS